MKPRWLVSTLFFTSGLFAVSSQGAGPAKTGATADELARLAIAARYSGPYEELFKEFTTASEAIREKEKSRARKPTGEELTRMRTIRDRLEAEHRIREGAATPRIELSKTLSRLERTRNDGVTKLIAPLLGEESSAFDYGDYSIPDAAWLAADCLRRMMNRGLSIPNASKNTNVAEWRAWWAENRARYEPIPDALKRLEENQREAFRTSPPSQILSQFTSKTGRLVVELRGAFDSPTEVWIGPASNPEDRELLFRQPDELEVSTQVSEDDRLILVLWGSASAGSEIEVFERDRSGGYERHEIDLCLEAWELAKRSKLVPASALPAHLRCFPVRMPSKPLSVVFKLVGNYTPDIGSQTEFGPIYFRYVVESRKLDIIAEPP